MSRRPACHQLYAERRQYLQNCPERRIHFAAERSVKASAIYVRLLRNRPHSVGACEWPIAGVVKVGSSVASASLRYFAINFGLLRYLVASRILALDISQPPLK
jgi:hypothetical protein